MQVILQADHKPKQNHQDVLLPTHPPKTVLIGERTRTDLRHKNIRSPIIQCQRNWSIFFVLVVYLEKMMERLNHFVYSQHWSDEVEEHHGKRRRKQQIFQYCTDYSGEILYFRALQGHSGSNLVDPSLQDNVLIPDGFFKYIYHVGCAINVQHSIINSGMIRGGQKFEQTTDSILFACESYG